MTRPVGSSFDRRRTRSQQIRRGQWSGPQSVDAPAPDDDAISRYSDPSYIVGSSTPESLAATAERFSTDTNELPANEMPHFDININGFLTNETSNSSIAEIDGRGLFPIGFELDANSQRAREELDVPEYIRPRY